MPKEIDPTFLRVFRGEGGPFVIGQIVEAVSEGGEGWQRLPDSGEYPTLEEAESALKSLVLTAKP